MYKHEVELRAFVDNAQLKSLRSSLTKHSRTTTCVKDTYYCKKEVRDFSEVEMDEIGSFSLRLRQSNAGNNNKYSLNVKIITSYGDHHAWDEHEIQINSFREGEKILIALGYKKFFSISKTRESYECGNIKAIIEDLGDCGHAIEVEIMTEKSQSELA